MASDQRHTMFYTGVSRELPILTWKHKTNFYKGLLKGTTLIARLVYFEEYSTAREAITKEKQLKGWSRKKRRKHLLTGSTLNGTIFMKTLIDQSSSPFLILCLRILFPILQLRSFCELAGQLLARLGAQLFEHLNLAYYIALSGR